MISLFSVPSYVEKGFFFLIFVLPPKISEKNPKNPKKIRKIRKKSEKSKKSEKNPKNPKNPKKIQKIRKIWKNPKNPKKIRKIQGFFWGFKIRTPYLGVNNPSNKMLNKLFQLFKLGLHGTVLQLITRSCFFSLLKATYK